ncbi:MAG: SGNH/GDSL hydrolase family protein [Magnetococcales bacterium]|nr:SGNH/GDSL hydrolase family protein [Magnetococcales bacterium]
MNAPAAPAVRWPRILGLLILALLLTELAARIAFWVWSGESYRNLDLYRWSPYGLVRNNPQATSNAFKINPNGFRNLETFQPRKPPDTYRVLMLGGSVLYAGLGGWYPPETRRVPTSETIAQHLAERLRADPRWAGRRVEVLNAAVNFNRIVEVSGAYLGEFINWDPDLVIVFGSANNFFHPPPEHGDGGQIVHSLASPHVWAAEFDRRANEHTLMTLLETAHLTARHYSAAAALAHKFLSKAIDAALALSERLRVRTVPLDGPAPPPAQPLSDAAFDRYVDDYLAHADAMIAAARRRQQKIVFFWEYFLAHVAPAKPMGAAEALLARHNQSHATASDREFTLRARDRVARELAAQGVELIDPWPELTAWPKQVYIDYLHYTAEGNEFMAEVLYRRIW